MVCSVACFRFFVALLFCVTIVPLTLIGDYAMLFKTPSVPTAEPLRITAMWLKSDPGAIERGYRKRPKCWACFPCGKQLCAAHLSQSCPPCSMKRMEVTKKKLGNEYQSMYTDYMEVLHDAALKQAQMHAQISGMDKEEINVEELLEIRHAQRQNRM